MVTSQWSSPCVLVLKPYGNHRFCTDFRRVNATTKSDSHPLSRKDDCIDRTEHARYISKFDLLKGYWQVPLTEMTKEVFVKKTKPMVPWFLQWFTVSLLIIIVRTKDYTQTEQFIGYTSRDQINYIITISYIIKCQVQLVESP